MIVKDSRTGFPLFDSAYNPFKGPLPTQEDIAKGLKPMILSASGWRKVFAQSGDAESAEPEITKRDAYLAAAAALVHAAYLKTQKKDPSVLVGVDARPTGYSIAQCAIRAFLAEGVTVRYLFIASAPEIMAENARGDHGCDGFFYISASHNPLGHNGIKFGGAGGVYPGSVTGPFATRFKELLGDPASIQQKLLSVDEAALEEVYRSSGKAKAESLKTYHDFVLETGERPIGAYQELLRTQPLGVVIDFNGSARADSIDVSLLEELGARLMTVNDKCREVAHGIVPEGENLQLCKDSLEMAHQSDPSFVVGYLPDNDGDRGNIVVWDDASGSVVVPPAQEVFALVAMATLSEMQLSHPEAKLAIAVNGPTSMRIDRIADAFGCKVFRSEVGEANVVQLAGQLRDQGYLVKILGEGSNGGNITDPAKVRDPMNTIITLLKLLGDSEIMRNWCGKSGQPMPRNITLSGVLDSLPVFTTTGAFSKDGTMQVHLDAGTLKRNYEKVFRAEWKEHADKLKEEGIYGYRIYQSEGTVTREGIGEEFRHAPFKGGWKACFLDQNGEETGFIWMRPSGTEPIFRVLCDVEGNRPALHDKLLAWHRSMVQQADNL